MKVEILPRTFKEWMLKQFDHEELSDMASHGVDCGYSGLIYTSECVSLHDAYERELWDALYEDAKEFGHDNVPSFMATWNRKDMLNDLDQMKNMIVWYFAEKIANEEENK